MKLKQNLSQMRNFIIFWAGQSCSGFGSAMTAYALILWSYGQLRTASSIVFLTAFTTLPSILFSFLAGAIADRWDKKKMMVLGDCFAACGTLSILILTLTGGLQVWHLYIVNFLISCMNAFQSSAANVLITLMTPKDHYARANGMFSLSGSVSTILTPAAATALYLAGGLVPVLLIDLATFAFAVVSLIWKIRLPNFAPNPEERVKSILESCLDGIRYLGRQKALLRVILIFAVLNLSAHMGSMGLYSALVLSRTGGDESALGMVSAAIGIGTLLGSLLVTLLKPAKRRTRVIYLSCILMGVFFDLPIALGRNLWVWCAAGLAGYLFLPLINANLSSMIRIKVPVGLQGRVLSARTTLQCWTIPAGLFLGGLLSDHAFEPFMQGSSGFAALLQGLLGSGKGAGIALLILIQGVFSLAVSVREFLHPGYRELDNDEPLEET